MARYSMSHQTPAGSDLGIMTVSSDGTVRPAVYDIIIGSDASPADIATEFMVERNTDEGTTPSATPTAVKLDPATAAASSTTTGGTYATDPANLASNELLMIALNQRATFRWVAAPDSELVAPATDNDGIFLRSVASGGTPNINATFLWKE